MFAIYNDLRADSAVKLLLGRGTGLDTTAVPGYRRGGRMMTSNTPDTERPINQDVPTEAPETPTNEPKPTPVQDPPAEPDPAPYVVRGYQTGHTSESRIMNEVAKGPGERKERRGFASMSPEKQREIASKGGRAAHQKGTAHEWTSEEARSAGRKGGQISRGGRGRLDEPTEAAPAAASPDGNVNPGGVDGQQ